MAWKQSQVLRRKHLRPLLSTRMSQSPFWVAVLEGIDHETSGLAYIPFLGCNKDNDLSLESF